MMREVEFGCPIYRSLGSAIKWGDFAAKHISGDLLTCRVTFVDQSRFVSGMHFQSIALDLGIWVN
jgi:hypothetical protein